MHIDARNIENNSIIEGDICIIGAGAAGLAIALDWINTPYKVILLEGGGFEFDEKLQELYKGTSTGANFPPMNASRLHQFGGTTGLWGGFCSPFDPIDFKERSWVPNSGWPIQRKDLDPFYERASKVIQLGPYNYDLKYWQKQMPNMNTFPFDAKIISTKIWQFNHLRFGKEYKDTIVNARNIHLYIYANVVDIQTNSNASEINQLVIKNYTGKTHTVKAKKFIMACGAIQNTRLLLASNTIAKAGLGNDNDLVGRYFMEHLEYTIADLYMLKPFHTNLYSFDFNTTKVAGELCITPETQEKEQILNGTSSFHIQENPKDDETRIASWKNFENQGKLQKDNLEMWQKAEQSAKEGNGNVGKLFQMNIRIEQAPNPNSRVTLGKEKDALGVPRASMNWDLTELDKRSIRKIHYLIGQEMGKSGFGRLKLREPFVDENDMTFPKDIHGGNHHMGTMRMNNDPKKGVVNDNCQVHGIHNLFIAGSACFPTAGAPNPTMTLIAMSLRLSDHIKTLL
jgi:choline dehydrogenase-like flavoprotein